MVPNPPLNFFMVCLIKNKFRFFHISGNGIGVNGVAWQTKTYEERLIYDTTQFKE